MSILPRSRLYNSFKYSLLQLPGRRSVKSRYFVSQQHRTYSETIPDDDDNDDDDDDDDDDNNNNNNNNNRAENILKYRNLTIEI
jgi:hypothetical protein